jgi:hypothetical protein
MATQGAPANTSGVAAQLVSTLRRQSCRKFSAFLMDFSVVLAVDRVEVRDNQDVRIVVDENALSNEESRGAIN